MAREEKTLTELELQPTANVDRANDYLWTVDTSDTSMSAYGTSKKVKVEAFIGDTGEKGDPGDEIELQKTDTHVQWRYVGGTWTNLIALADITGPQGIQGEQGVQGEAGREIEIQKGTTHIQWRYVGDALWTDLIAISEITGPQGEKGIQGDPGVDGEDAYVYIAYASDSSGTGFTMTFDPALDYIAIKSTNTEITTPQASDFTGLWKNYKGATGATGPQGEIGLTGAAGEDAYVYIAYASDDSGTDFTTTFNPALDYIAIKSTNTEIPTPQASDFTGLWKNYKGAKGDTGPAGADGADGLDINWRGTYSALTSYVVNDAVFYEGSSYICILASTGNLPTNETYWNLMAQEGAAGEGSGDVSGPSGATDNAVARFDLTTGKLIQNSLVTIDDDGSVNIPAGQQYLVGGSPVEGYSDEQAQDAVGNILTDSSEIDFTYNDTTPSITASIKAGSIDETKLDTSVNASLDLADSAIQSADLATVATTGAYSDLSGTPDLTTKLDKATNVTAINDTSIADGEIAVFNLTNKDIRTSDKTITTTLGADDTTVPTSKAVKDVTDTKITAFADPNADRIVFWDDSASAFAPLTASTGLTLSETTLTVRAASETATGIVERATNAEFTTGTDTTRYVTANQIANVAQNMGNKTLTSPVINTGVSGTAILDEDNMASDSATKLATQQSIKAYVDSKGYTWKGEWVTSTAYVVNDTVEYNGSGYICIVAHTSGTFATDLTNGKWEMFVEGVNADSIASTIHGATAKTTPVDADEVGLIDSAASNVLKKLTWSNIKATLKSYFDSVTTTLTNKTIDGRSNTITNAIPAGVIEMFGGSSAPTGYLLCDGSAVSRTTYSALFTAIGTTYGSGDGSTTFNLPNLKGKVAVGLNSADTSFDTLGETGGEKTHTLTTAEMPVHLHGIAYSSEYYLGNSGWSPALGSGGGNINTKNAGGGEAHNNLQPYIVLNYIIKT